MTDSERLEYELHKGLIVWYDFEPKSTILCIGIHDSIMSYLIEQGHKVKRFEYSDLLDSNITQTYEQYFDYVFAVEIIEKMDNPENILTQIRSMTKETGRVLLGVDNRLGLRYFCGDSDPYTGRCFDGIEDYQRIDHHDVNTLGGKCYSKNEIDVILEKTGFDFTWTYSVLPNLDTPQLIYAQDYLPRESLATRYMPMYRNPEHVFLQEKYIYDSLIQNGLFHQMANSYLVECSVKPFESNIKHVTLSLDRGDALAYATVIKKDTVEKKALYEDGKIKLQQLIESEIYLKQHGISIVEGTYKNDTYVMPYVEAPIASNYLQSLFTQDIDMLIQRMDEYRDEILKSSEIVEENELGPILKRGYIDMVPLNCFWKDNKFLFYDQEFYEENVPANLMLWRTIAIIYDDDPTRMSILPKSVFYKRYKMETSLDVCGGMAAQFIQKLRNQNALAEFNQKKVILYADIEQNKKLLENEKEEKIMENMNKQNEASMADKFFEECREKCFDDLEKKRIYLFGSGKFADKFLAFYQRDYNIYRILDNDKSKWGLEMQGVPICSPEILKNAAGDYKVIICIKKYEEIVCQLKGMGVENIGIYDANYIYPGRQNITLPLPQEEYIPKRYRVGYISGVFDLFHIGHINMFKRAKEQCDYLIAAVTSDEYVRNHKKREPFIPFEERLEMVKSCKYVDEAVGVPYKYAGTVEAFQKYHFDCQFCGSDYADNTWWLEQKKYLQSNGSDLVFFSYTEQTSSTKIKALIEQKLM